MRCKRGWSVQPVEKGNEDGGYRKFGGCLYVESGCAHVCQIWEKSQNKTA